MKIRIVCERTGLSDRAIRYYVEEGLISPSYTENYTGRKTYDFSENDIKELHDIAVLRKFDFTIEEIRTIINDTETSKAILIEVKSRMESTVSNCQEKLAAITNINAEKAYSIAELAEELSKPSLKLPSHNETTTSNIARSINSILKATIISGIVWLPVALSLFVVLISIRDYQYPVFEPTMIALTIISCVPSLVVLILSRMKFPFNRIVRRFLLLLCTFCIPISFIMSFGIVSKSETTDFKNYRDFDAKCCVNRNDIFQELFPNWPNFFKNVKQGDGSYKTVYLDSHYYYHYHRGLDYTYDIYAEWPLNEAQFAEEISRVTVLFEGVVVNKKYNYEHVEMEKGDFNCLIMYNGDEPFTQATDSYQYIIFAYNEKSKIVRYIFCDSLENGADQPFYLSLDW